MRAKVGMGLVAVILLVFGLMASNLFVPPPAEAHQPLPVEPPPAVAKDVPPQLPPEARTPVPPPEFKTSQVPALHSPVLAHFTTSVTPIFEGGAIGEPVRLTVEIRGKPLTTTSSWRKKLPDKVKVAIESAMAEAASDEPPDPRLDEILNRLDKLEKRLKHFERQKASSAAQ
jgi:hypothetical protein